MTSSEFYCHESHYGLYGFGVSFAFWYIYPFHPDFRRGLGDRRSSSIDVQSYPDAGLDIELPLLPGPIGVTRTVLLTETYDTPFPDLGWGLERDNPCISREGSVSKEPLTIKTVQTLISKLNYSLEEM